MEEHNVNNNTDPPGGKAGQIERDRAWRILFFFLFWQRSGGFSTHRASEQEERAAIVIVWEICSLFVRAPLHAADTKISHVIGFARRGGGTECSSLCIWEMNQNYGACHPPSEGGGGPDCQLHRIHLMGQAISLLGDYASATSLRFRKGALPSHLSFTQHPISFLRCTTTRIL